MDSLCLRGSALSKKGCPPKAGVNSVARICSAAQAVAASLNFRGVSNYLRREWLKAASWSG